MKLTFLLGILIVFSSSASEIESTEISRGRYLAKGHNIYPFPLKKLVSIITDYTHACQTSQCRYHVPNVEETRIFSGQRDGQFYTWTKIKSIKSGSYFSHVQIEHANQEVTISNVMVSETLGQELAEQFNLPHQPIMQTTMATWILVEKVDAQGNFKQTDTVIKIETSSNNFLITRFPNQVLKNLKETIEALLTNLN